MNTKLIILVSAAALLSSCRGEINMQRLIGQQSEVVVESLCDNWSFKRTDSDTLVGSSVDWTAATVPGTVHTDLLAAGLITEPFASTAENELQWIEKCDWEYRTNFKPSASFMARQKQELVFQGLDTYADVYLNDSLILSADNMFLEWRVDVKDILRATDNELVVKFRNTYKEGLKAASKYSVKLPADNDKGEVKTSVFTRKAPYNFGWDWGPRFLTVGVWRPVELVGWNTAHIENVHITQQSLNEDIAQLHAKIKINSISHDNKINIILADSLGTIYASEKLDLDLGDTVIDLDFEIQNPRLWWPNGTGEANLYSVITVLANRDNQNKLDQRVDNIGLRTVRLVQQKDSVGEGQSFYFEVNGEPVFAKGANSIPHDVFLPRLTPEKYADFIAQCKESNYNMLRVWGGGIYESDAFYDLCDRNGIMVWQDFIFGCSFYPWDKEFLENVRREATQNVRRLRNHPSLVIWCGNNEISEAWHHWGYQKVYGWTEAEQKMIWAGYKALFEGVLPEVLALEDTSRYYHPSSPLYGRGNPKSQIMGDVHYWGVFHDEEPFSVYKDKPGRFSNEYGFQSLACYDTYREYLEPEEMVLYSNAMHVHQKNPKGYRVMEEYMVRDLPLLKDDFRTYVYLTQLLQAEGIKIAMEGHRQKRPWTMGSLYWQVNDCWPVASWSSIDSRGRWKALQYYAKRSFAPTSLSFERIDSTSEVKLWAVTDRLHQIKGEVKLTLMDFTGKVIKDKTIKLDVPRNGNQQLMHLAEKEVLLGADPRTVVLVAQTVVDNVPLRALHYFVPMKNLLLPKPDFNMTINDMGSGNKVQVVLQANTLLRAVLLEADKLQGKASDAYFDMLPGEKKVVELSFDDHYAVNDLGVYMTSLGHVLNKKKR